jgi:hypothetical protein
VQVRVTRVWEDGRITVDLAGQKVTMRQDNDAILEVTPAARERPYDRD